MLSAPPILILLAILTDNRYHLAWRGFTYVESIQPQFGPLGWVAFAYVFGVLGTVNLIVFGWLFLRSPLYRGPVVLMLVGQFGGRTIYLLERAGYVHSALPVDLLGMALEFLMYAVALFGFRIFDPIPLARQTAIEQLHAGMLVLDPQGKIVSLNPAAEYILGKPVKHARGHPLTDLLPVAPQSIEEAQEEGIAQGEILLGAGPDSRCYQWETSSLKDWRGLLTGYLFLMQDVTGQKQAQAQIVEQQRALAMLHERERLAHELHDSTSQVLGFASLKLGAARKLIADNRLERADEQLEKLESAIAEAHSDLREYILNLRLTPTGEKPFFTTLNHYLDGYRQNYDIRVELSIQAGLDDGLFAPDVQLQLFRILQEALSNARKHAGADCVRVAFERIDDLVRISIRNNGRGFDPQHVANLTGDHFGLSFMRERAETLGGTLRVDSSPGKGTCVVVEVPGNLSPSR